MKKFLSVLLATVILGSCSSSEPVSDDVIHIGVIASMTGPGAFYGENIRKGVELAVYEINEQGGIDGRELKAFYEDDATEPKRSVSAMQYLLDHKDPLAIIGGQWDFLLNATVPIANEEEIVLISPVAEFDSLLPEFQKSPFVFSSWHAASNAIPTLEQFLDEVSAETLIIIAVNNDWGSVNVNAMTEAARGKNVDVLDIFRLSQTDSNMQDTILTKVREFDPDAVFVVSNHADILAFVKRYREFGLGTKVLMHETFFGLLQSEKLSLEETEDFFYFKYAEPGSAFAEAFKSFHGSSPQIGSDTAYDAAMALVEAMKIGGVSRDGIAEGMQSVSLDGASGLIDFTRVQYPEKKVPSLKKVTEEGIIVVQ